MPAPLALTPDPDPTTAELVAARPHLSMHAMDGLLMEGVPLNAIADAVGSPTWVLSANCIRGRLRQLQDAMANLPLHIHYAVKANDHLAVLRLVAQAGAGVNGVEVAGTAQGSATGMLVSDPTNPLADAAGYVRRPDIDLGEQMGDLIMAQRGYQANAAVVDRAKTTYEAALQIGRA